MASATEVNSLNQIHYKSKVRTALLVIAGVFVFLIAFMNYFPIGEKIKHQLKLTLAKQQCPVSIGQIRFEIFLPKIVIEDLMLPASCLGRTGAPLKFAHVTLNYHLINFAPFGLPFRLDTELAGQQVYLYYVLGIGKQMVRLKDQQFNLSSVSGIMNTPVKLAGSITLDVNLALEENVVKSLELKAVSKDFLLQAQTISLPSFPLPLNLPTVKVGELYLDAVSQSYPKLVINKLVIGEGANSPIRGNLKGSLRVAPLLQANPEISGEIAFSENLKQQVPVEALFQIFDQKDGFYQVKIDQAFLQKFSPQY